MDEDIFPAEFAKAVEFDRQLRNVNRQTEIGNDDLAFFVHKSCQPLDEVEFNAADKDQVDMFNTFSSVMYRPQGAKT